MAKPDGHNVNLTPRQARFVEEFLVDLNGTAAAERAGYGGGKGGAAVASSRLLRNPVVAERIAAAKEARAARVEERLSTTVLNADRVLEEVAHVALLDPVAAFEKDGSLKSIHDMPEALRRAISEITVRKDDEGATVTRVRFWDKGRFMELCMRHLGMLRDKVELTGKDGEPLTVELVRYDAQRGGP